MSPGGQYSDETSPTTKKKLPSAGSKTCIGSQIRSYMMSNSPSIWHDWTRWVLAVGGRLWMHHLARRDTYRSKNLYIYIMNPIYILVSPEAADPGWKCRLRFWFASLRNEYIHINHHTPVSTLTQIYQNLTFCMPRNPRWVWMSGTPYGATIVHRFSYAPFISVPRHLVCDSLGWAWIGDQSADATPKSLPRCWATLLRPVFSGWKDVGRQKSTVV